MQTEIPPSEIVEPVDAVVEAEPKPRRNLRWLYLLPVVFGLGMLAGYLIFALPLRNQVSDLRTQLAAAQSAQAAQGQAAEPDPKQIRRYDVPLDDDPILGNPDAPITIVEFSDYECPFCRKWHVETWPQIQAKYGEQVRLVYRDFPLYGMHANADPAAQAANCAGEQEAYWPFHEALFKAERSYDTSLYDEIATNLGLDLPSFQACIKDQRYAQEVLDDYQWAAELGVSSTPTFFVNGVALVGAQPFEVFDKLITMELNGEIP